ncbi:hypothetical protein Sango_1219500 [Sesamum angolense]|uniref:Agenet-like domain-containing protein n=1 Tax=Sesamum angolense TaxID=2727404 RepID=A0AAE2BX91_9LAMI|nr:hypothetical protein Sango_1219500 [Sesamum angolense]
MRFKKGDKVEVMGSKDVPVSWRAAEILSCICHTYRVQYDSYPGMASNQMVEMVPLKFLRPRPPLVKGVESCIAGDIVEVFYEYSWKIAAILKSSQAGDDVIPANHQHHIVCRDEFQAPHFNARAKSRPRKYLMNIQDNAATC